MGLSGLRIFHEERRPVVHPQRSPPEEHLLVRSSLFETALVYLRRGWSVVPLRGKCPTVRWQALQQVPASESQVCAWYTAGLLQNLGVVCGAASQRLVVLDVDSEVGYAAFRAAFPSLVETYTVRTGSGQGYHLYWVVEQLPATLRVRSPTLGSIELLAQGCQVVAPPSLHPQTGKCYTVERAQPLLTVSNVDDVRQWLNNLRQADLAYRSHALPASRHRRDFPMLTCELPYWIISSVSVTESAARG
jgi:hypothetical protein